MNTILLEPTDVLFFRDGRPMGGASSGQGAAWPLPNVINHAFHAALHRAEFEGVHSHRRGRSGEYEETRDRKFGSLTTVGPFPVCLAGKAHTWFFPRPADADGDGHPVLHPVHSSGPSSLPAPLMYPVGSTIAPSKETPKNWWSEGAWNTYLDSPQRDKLAQRSFFKTDSDFSETEHHYGIEIAPDTGSVVDGKFYSAHYLRLREGWRLGAFAGAFDKDLNEDLVKKMLNGHGKEIITGGQQRICTATLQESANARLPLPVGATITGTRVKWVLLTPAIFPQIGEHTGGWLPSWVSLDGSVQLLDGPGKNYAKRHNMDEGKRIPARLVAASTGKPIPVTGYALPNSADPDRAEGGAKSTHLAVPAGSVYYFEADAPEAAQKLAAALNWHGMVPQASPPSIQTQARGLSHTPAGSPWYSTIRNRRSTLLGEQGFGLGVCGNWEFYPAS